MKRSTLHHLSYREKLWINVIYPQTVKTGQEKYPKIQMFNKNSDVSPRFDFSYFFEKARSVEHVHLKLETFDIIWTSCWADQNMTGYDFLRVQSGFFFGQMAP